MKVLWFSLSPCGSLRRYNVQRVIQGWMISLEDEIKKYKDIELSVAYFSDVEETPFEYDGVMYYPMGKGRPRNPIKRVWNRCRTLSSIDAERMPWLKHVIDESHPDLIHIHGTEDSYGLITPYAKERGIPVVYSIQGMIAPYSEFFFRGIPKHDAFRLDSLFDRLKNDGIRNEWRSFRERAKREKKYLCEADYVFGRTFWDRNCSLALNPKREYMVVNEVLRPEFYTKQWKGKISENKLTIISTISGGIYKGMETALKAADLLKQYCNIDFEWIVVGYDNSSKWVRIAEHVAGVRCSECNMKLLGRLDANQLSDILCLSDMYVQISHIENSPNSVCEAMLLGMPVIASFAGGTASIVENNKEGVLYQDGDPYALCGAIVNYYSNPEIALSYAGAAREKALIRHNPNTIAKDLIDDYQYIISQN